MADSFVLNFSAQVTEPGAFGSYFDRLRQCVLGNTQQLIDAFVDHSNRDCRGRIPYPAVLDDTDIQLHDVAILNPALTADAVNDLVIQRDANVAGKNPMTKPIAEERALHPRFRHEISGCFIDFLGRNARPNDFAESVEHVAGGATSYPHFFDLAPALDRNHAGTFPWTPSINRVI